MDREEKDRSDDASGQSHPDQSASQERLQKIIAAAGITSRRKAEELITTGRVQVNGKVVTELGTKADPERDHIRVDGKLLQGAERHRYFLLNKPKGYVTTASDPEGRHTVMEFFRGGERVFPVGRLDYMSEGLLLLTNDGDLANALTRAAAKVEKTYLVKVSGKPSDAALEQLRSGIMIDRGRTGSRPGERSAPAKGRGKDRVMTAPAKIRLARDAENPWYEMVLIEGRNREIRKMFEEVGHHVEKIRRIGYGPLVLDVEPGKLRELDPQEVEALKRATRPRTKAAGKRKEPLPGAAKLKSPRPPRRSGRKPHSGSRRTG
jgi:23S rRNA pseudouridine2605 synthase